MRSSFGGATWRRRSRTVGERPPRIGAGISPGADDGEAGLVVHPSAGVAADLGLAQVQVAEVDPGAALGGDEAELDGGGACGKVLAADEPSADHRTVRGLEVRELAVDGMAGGESRPAEHPEMVGGRLLREPQFLGHLPDRPRRASGPSAGSPDDCRPPVRAGRGRTRGRELVRAVPPRRASFVG